MRHDMHAVLMVSPSRKKCAPKGVAVCEVEEAPIRQKMRHNKGGKRKNYGRYNPLRAYLAKQVGRRWDDVFSEICANNDYRSQSQFDLRQKVGHMVETNVILIDGEPYDSTGVYSIWYNNFWVHPETGVLMASSEKKRRGCHGWRTEYKQVPIDATHKYVEIAGVWYIVTFAPFTRENCDTSVGTTFQRGVPGGYDNVFAALFSLRYRKRAKDVVFGSRLAADFDSAQRQLQLEWGGSIYACHKRQIGSREVKQVKALWAVQEAARHSA